MHLPNAPVKDIASIRSSVIFTKWKISMMNNPKVGKKMPEKAKLLFPNNYLFFLYVETSFRKDQHKATSQYVHRYIYIQDWHLHATATDARATHKNCYLAQLSYKHNNIRVHMTDIMIQKTCMKHFNSMRLQYCDLMGKIVFFKWAS